MSFILVYNIVEWAIRIGMVPVILRRRMLPAVSLAWLSITFFLPLFGVIAYALIGDARLGRKRRRLHRGIVVASRRGQRMTRQRDYITRPRVDQALLPVIMQAEHIGGMPILGGNAVELIGKSEAVIDRLIEDINAASHHVHMVFYIYAPDETGQRVADALIAAAKRGVTCRLLVDGAGSRAMLHGGLAARMRSQGVDVREALPVRLLRRGLQRIDLRNHRKLAVIDGHTAYTGSQNIVDADYGKGRGVRRLKWVDLSGRFTGPLVHQLQVVFLEDWAFETDQWLAESPDDAMLPPVEKVGGVAAQVVPSGPGDSDFLLPHVLLAAINAARQRIVITTPYFVPDEPTLMALLMAAQRGVKVELIVPQKSDHWLVTLAGRFYFDPLLEAGVRVHLFKGGLLHAKTMTVDDSFGLLGSTNLDVRSFYLNFELNVLIYDTQTTHELRFAQQSYLAESEEIKIDLWRKRPRIKKLSASAAALLSPLL